MSIKSMGKDGVVPTSGTDAGVGDKGSNSRDMKAGPLDAGIAKGGKLDVAGGPTSPDTSAKMVSQKGGRNIDVGSSPVSPSLSKNQNTNTH